MPINVRTSATSSYPKPTGDFQADYEALAKWVEGELRDMRNDVAEVARAARFDSRKRIRVKVDTPGQEIQIEHGLGRLPTALRTTGLDVDSSIGRSRPDLGDHRVLYLKTSESTPQGSEFDIEVD